MVRVSHFSPTFSRDYEEPKSSHSPIQLAQCSGSKPIGVTSKDLMDLKPSVETMSICAEKSG